MSVLAVVVGNEGQFLANITFLLAKQLDGMVKGSVRFDEGLTVTLFALWLLLQIEGIAIIQPL